MCSIAMSWTLVSNSDGSPPPPQLRPLSRLALQLVLGKAGSDAVARVAIDRPWVLVERGPGELDPASFRLEELCFDSFRQLVPLAEA